MRWKSRPQRPPTKEQPRTARVGVAVPSCKRIHYPWVPSSGVLLPTKPKDACVSAFCDERLHHNRGLGVVRIGVDGAGSVGLEKEGRLGRGVPARARGRGTRAKPPPRTCPTPALLPEPLLADRLDRSSIERLSRMDEAHHRFRERSAAAAAGSRLGPRAPTAWVRSMPREPWVRGWAAALQRGRGRGGCAVQIHARPERTDGRPSKVSACVHDAASVFWLHDGLTDPSITPCACSHARHRE